MIRMSGPIKIIISQLIFDLAQNDKIVASMDSDIYDKPTPYFEEADEGVEVTKLARNRIWQAFGFECRG